MNRAIFLDRDGTLMQDKGYICHFREVDIYPFSLPALRKISEHGFLTVIVTNQSAIARGICTEEQVRQVHREIQRYCRERGAIIDAIYFSPYLENGTVAQYRKKDLSRKPGPGMILQAASDFRIDPGSSWMIGDNFGDIVAGKRAGCKTALVLTGKGPEAKIELGNNGINPDLVAANLLVAVDSICQLSV